MRVIWQKEFDALLKNNLTEEELQRYEKSFELPICSFEDLRVQSDIQLPLFLKAVGCHCFTDFITLRDKALNTAKQVLGGDVSRYLKERTTPEYLSALQKLSRKYTRERKCHINLRSMVCYCDEHSH